MATVNVKENFIHLCIEEIGFGKFQLLALSMAFMKTFTFSSMICLVIIIEPYLRCQMHLTTLEASWIITVEALTRIFSTAWIGRLSDFYGRQRAIRLFFALHVVASVLNALSSSLMMIVITRAAIGVFSPCRAAVFAYVLEVLPTSKRKHLAGTKLFAVMGTLFSTFTGMLTLHYLNWRWFVIIAEGIPAVVCLIIAAFLPESPRFLHSMGRHQEAIATLENIAIMNGKDPMIVNKLNDLTCEVEDDEDAQMSTLEFVQKVSVLSLFVYTGVILASVIAFGTMQFGENAEIRSCGRCETQLNYNYLLSEQVARLISFIVTFIILSRCERIFAIRILLSLTILTLIPLFWNIKSWALISVLVIFTLINSPFIIICTVYEGELLPTNCRSRGMGVIGSIGYFGMAFGAFLSVYVYHESRYICFGILLVISVIAVVTACLVPWKTKDKALKDR